MTTTNQDRRDGRRLAETPVLLALGIILIGVFTSGFLLRPAPPSDGSVDAGFARDMAMHHAQAVEMALIIRDRTESDTLRYVATDIVLTQQNQIGQMRAWLGVWGLPPNGEDLPMTWMGHPVEGLMPGMASAEEINGLRDLPLPEAEVEFLRLMIAHHQAGVDMASAAQSQASEDVVRELASAMVAGQQKEINALQALLQERGVTAAGDELTSEQATSGHAHAGQDVPISESTLRRIVSLAPLAIAGFTAAWLIFDHRGRTSKSQFALDVPAE